MKISKSMIFTVLFIVSVVFVFFVGRNFDAQTGTRSFMFTTNGLAHFRKGLDVSGGTKLVYKISYDKYEKVYTNTIELAAVKKTIETIIMKNIDNRISKL
jgi:preprotein translocase subunit SecD